MISYLQIFTRCSDSIGWWLIMRRPLTWFDPHGLWLHDGRFQEDGYVPLNVESHHSTCTRDWEISEVQTQFVADHLDQLTSLLLEEIRLTDLQETEKP